jgi:hypothetical protein
MTRIEKAIANVAASDPHWWMERLADVRRLQRERMEKARRDASPSRRTRFPLIEPEPRPAPDPLGRPATPP